MWNFLLPGVGVLSAEPAGYGPYSALCAWKMHVPLDRVRRARIVIGCEGSGVGRAEVVQCKEDAATRRRCGACGSRLKIR